MSFTADISRFVKKAKGQEEIVIRKIGLDLFTRVVMKSPVDTGRFRGNWNLSINYSDSTVNNSVDKSGMASISKASSGIGAFKINDNAIYITNALPYAERLEFGYSKQAPQGMARTSVMEIAGKYR